MNTIKRIILFVFANLILTHFGYSQQNGINDFSGSWGVTFGLYGGDLLDHAVENRGVDYLKGAQELVENIPEAGHIMTTLTWFAHPDEFNLLYNTNVDIANEIHPYLVPEPEQDAMTVNVYNTFKNSGKKVIAYIAVNFFSSADADVKEAWENYYNTKFNGDEYEAYKDLQLGFIERTKDLVDGYWLDGASHIDAVGKLDDFIAAIRSVHPGCVISSNDAKNYFKNDQGQDIYVDSDGHNDEDPQDYRIVSHNALNDRSDFTNGHVTPLAQGAPPNSWAYEEYTISDIKTNPWSVSGSKSVLKHGWFPVRERWHIHNRELLANTEQAYRMVKNVVDGGGMITYATTVDQYNGSETLGKMMPDELEIMSEISNRLSNNANYEAYERPAGACIVGDCTTYWDWYENATSIENVQFKSVNAGEFNINVTNPSSEGNDNLVVSKLLTTGTSSFANFTLARNIDDLEGLKINLMAYLDLESSDLVNQDVKLKVYLQNFSMFDEGTISREVSISETKTWKTYEVDFTNLSISSGILEEGGFDRIRISIVRNGVESDFDTYIDTIRGTVDQSPCLNSELQLLSGNTWYHNYATNEFPLDLVWTSKSTLFDQDQSVANPTNCGNSSEKVSLITKDETGLTLIKFNLPYTITSDNLNQAIFKLKAYFRSESMDEPPVFTFQLREGNSLHLEKSVTIETSDRWVEFTFDFSDETISDEILLNSLFISTRAANDFNLDAFQGPGDSETTTNNFMPDSNKTYYIDAPYHNLRLASTGESEDAYTTSTNTTGADVEWRFIQNANGYWHIQRAAGGTVPRLRTDNTEFADMQGTDWNGTYTYYELSEGYMDNTFFLTLPDGPLDYQRLQINNAGNIKFVPTSHALTWESFTITEAGSLVDFSRIEAEDFDAMSGIQTEVSTESGENVGYINNGDWIRFDNVNISGSNSVDLRIASETEGGTIELRTGSTTGTLLGSVNVSNTGGWQNWNTLSTSINNASGTQDVYLVFKGAEGYLFNINWLEFSNASASAKSITDIITEDVMIYPNPVESIAIISGATNSILEIYDVKGVLAHAQNVLSESEQVDLTSLSTGIYYAKVSSSQSVDVIKIVKQ